MNDLKARSFSTIELAREYEYHSDAGVAKLAQAALEQERRDDEEESFSREADRLQAQVDDLKVQNESLKDVLQECLDALTNRELIESIKVLLA